MNKPIVCKGNKVQTFSLFLQNNLFIILEGGGESG